MPNWGVPTRRELNYSLRPDEWLEMVLDERVREVFRGREKIERMLT